MSRVSIDVRNEILAQLATGNLSDKELAEKYAVTEAFVADAREQVQFCISNRLLSRDGINFQAVSGAIKPLESFTVLLTQAGMSIEQIHAITKISRFRIKHLRAALNDSGIVICKPLYVPSRPTSESRVIISLFAINYKQFSSENTSLLNVLIALNISHKQATELFPHNKNELTLGEAYSIAEDIDSEKQKKPVQRTFCLDYCTKCKLPYLRAAARYRKRLHCPFCALFAQKTENDNEEQDLSPISEPD